VQREHIFDISCYKIGDDNTKEDQKEKSDQSAFS
jgi:hypothetical protein